MDTPVAMICIDGLSWDLLRSFFDEGLLPHFKKMIDEGSSGMLQSIKPLISPRIWATIYTGKSPNDHGIQDFYDNHIQSKQIWDIVHSTKKTIGVFYPLTLFKANQVNGFIVPGPLAVTPFTHPQDLAFIKHFAMAVRRNNLSFSNLVKYALTFTRKGCSFGTLAKAGLLFLRLLLSSKPTILESLYRKKEVETLLHSDVFKYLLKRHSPSFAVFYDNGIDCVSHYYWKDMVSKKAGVYSKYGDVIKRHYHLMDTFLGQLNEILNDDWTILIVSDHGFKADTRIGRAISIDSLLKLLHLEDRVYGITLMNRSVILRPKNTEISTESISRIIQTVQTENGDPVFNVVHDDEYVELTFGLPKSTIQNNQIVVLPDSREYPLDVLIHKKVPRSGVHEGNGVFIIKGPNIKSGTSITNLSVYDVVPTLLALQHMPIPSDMNGRILFEIFTNELAQMKVQKISTYEDIVLGPNNVDALSDEHERNIKDKLMKLGYL